MAKVGPVVEALRAEHLCRARGKSGEGWGLVEMQSGGSVFYRMSLCLPASRRHQGRAYTPCGVEGDGLGWPWGGC